VKHFHSHKQYTLNLVIYFSIIFRLSADDDGLLYIHPIIICFYRSISR